MKQAQQTNAGAEAFAAQARKAALGMLVDARERGETVRDEGDYVARAMDQIYMDAGRERRAQRRTRGNP